MIPYLLTVALIFTAFCFVDVLQQLPAIAALDAFLAATCLRLIQKFNDSDWEI